MTTVSTSCASAPKLSGLSRLGEVVLASPFQALFESGTQLCLGTAPFRSRKKAELHEFLALAQVSGRIQPLALKLEDALQVLFELVCPVPVMDAGGNFQVFDRARIFLRYPEEAIRKAMPGYAFIEIVEPQGVWLPNVSRPDAERGIPLQALCLGASLPPGIRVRELVLMTFGALTMQAIQMNALDPAGIMNPLAARWWQSNLARIPLTAEPFLIPQSC